MIVLKHKHGKGNTDYYYVKQQAVLREKEGKMVPEIDELRFSFNLKMEKDGGYRFTKQETLTAGQLFLALEELTHRGYHPVYAEILDCQIIAKKFTYFDNLVSDVNAQLMNRGEEPLFSD